MAPPPPFGLGLGLKHPFPATTPPLPSGATLDLNGAKGLTLGSGGIGGIGIWLDQVTSYPMSFFGTVGNVTLGSLNGVAAPSWGSGSVTSYFSDTGGAFSDFISGTGAEWTIACVAEYTGSVTSSGTNLDMPTIFGEVGGTSYLSMLMSLDATDTTRIRVMLGQAFSILSVEGAPGSSSSAHFMVAQSHAGTLSLSLDGGTPATLGVSTPLTLGNSATAGYNPGVGSPTEWVGTVARILVWGGAGGGTVSVSAINANLAAAYSI